LAILGVQDVTPNPVVGAVIVENEEIIGEGWHKKYGKAHAEINALNSVQSKNRGRLAQSTIFVSLEPCSIYGNTPPCTDAILNAHIPNVVISARDRTEGVDEISEYILNEKNLNLSYGIGYELGKLLAAPRNIFVSKKRPYIILKWAQSADGFIGRPNEGVPISNEFSKRYVHQLRSEVDAIVVGKNTAIIDNPSLTTRYFPGKNPLRVILGNLDLHKYQRLKLLSDNHQTVIVGTEPCSHIPNYAEYIMVSDGGSTQDTLCNYMYDRGLQKILVEGGATTLQGFIDAGLWDECRIITNSSFLEIGIKAPVFSNEGPSQRFSLLNDTIEVFHNF